MKASPDGDYWVSRVLETIDQLEKDSKHVSLLVNADQEHQALRSKARDVAERITKVAVLAF